MTRFANFPLTALTLWLGCIATAWPLSAQMTERAATAATATTAAAPVPVPAANDMTMTTFLDRLMLAESGGRDNVANPRSTAVGAFQFISSTFLAVAQRHFAVETAALSPVQVLALRTDRAFARRAAEAFTNDNAARLAGAGLPSTWPNLRLAFFAGAEGAVRVLQANPETSAASILGPGVVSANPFLAHMTTRDLIARSARDLQVPVSTAAGVTIDPAKIALAGLGGAKPKRVQIPVRCDLDLPSCRRWLALAERRRPAMIAAAKKPMRKGTT